MQLSHDLHHLQQTRICEGPHFLRTGFTNDGDHLHGAVGDPVGFLHRLSELHRVEMGLDEVFASCEENGEHENTSKGSLREKNRLAESEHAGVDSFRRIDETRKEQTRETLHGLNRELVGTAVGHCGQEIDGEEDFRWVWGLLNARHAQIDMFLRE